MRAVPSQGGGGGCSRHGEFLLWARRGGAVVVRQCLGALCFAPSGYVIVQLSLQHVQTCCDMRTKFS